MISNIAKLIKKQWASVVEDLIFDKPRRKSSAQSKQSGSESKGSMSIGGDGPRNRLNSMEDSVIDSEILTFGTQKAAGMKQKRSTTPTQQKNKNKKRTQVDDPIDEQEEIDEMKKQDTIMKKQ